MAANASATTRVRIWDLPTRLFHWTLLALAIVSFTTAKIGGNWMAWHFYSGYAILTLLLFRVLWGLVGSHYAMFANFVKGPAAVFRYLRGADGGAGHNPLGALSVLALLAAFLVQAGTGLFANDAIATEGPLAKLVSSATSDLATSIHKWNEWVMIALVATHLAAVLGYLFFKKQNLLQPMITGDKVSITAEAAQDDLRMRIRAVVFFGLAAGLVSYLVNL